MADAGKLVLGSSTFTALQVASLTVNSVARSAAAVASDVEITISITLSSALEASGLLYIEIPVTEFIANGDTKKYKTTASGST